ncbi:MAG: hypothetical protein NTX79_05355 [Candidatus Micrarchaeota archaeon]|nr:hypothetical protein [Candidatus Micrarchaeota archaeon]
MAKIPFCAFALILAAALLALPGCALVDQKGDAIKIDDKFTQKALVVPKYENSRTSLICKELDDGKPCYCMTCKNNSGLAGMLSSYYDDTLVNGTCGAYHCNQDDYAHFLDKKNDTEMRSFMLGSGQSFVSGGNANLFCNYTLQLATKWMRGKEGKPPLIPTADRAYCWLGRSMLPLYIYYTNGEDIDVTRTADIAKAFNAADVGPAILTTEAGWDGTDADAVGKVKAQIEALQTCKKCLKVLALKPSDYTALYSIFGMPGNIDSTFLDKVDAVGFGFRTNDYPHCDMDRIIYENVNFSHYILSKYSKPTIWLYVGASEGNSSIGNESTGGCEWDSAKVSLFYKELLARTGDLASAGVLGMSQYEFIDRSGPIPCNALQGCDFGMRFQNGSQKHPELNTWSDMCQEVNVRSEERKPLIFSRNGQGGMLCDSPDLQNSQALMHSGAEIASEQGLMAGEVEAAKKIRNLGCGEACPENTSMKKPLTYDNTNNGFDNQEHCTLYPIMDEYADNWDVSATYFRAIVEQESKFDPYAISQCVDITKPDGTHNDACNPKDYTMAQICDLAGMKNDPKCQKDKCTGPNQKPCAYGLAQCIDYPGKAYTDSNPYGKVIVPDPVNNPKNMPWTIASCGGEKYNPFDPGMSACCGANKFGFYLRGSDYGAVDYITKNWDAIKSAQEGGKCVGGLNADEKGWAAYYLASNRYFGADWAVLNDFLSQRDRDGDCCSGSTSGTCYQHYIDYLRSRNTPDLAPPGNDYGAQVMSRFRAAVTTCQSDCPS